MRLKRVVFAGAVGLTMVFSASGHATDGSDGTSRTQPPASSAPARERLAEAPREIGRSFRQVGDSVEHGAKTIGHAVEDGAKQFGRSVAEGWRSFKRGLAGD
jgi:hypothetical protein